ncbi:MAG: hypothetical protein KF718_05970 [Polyangiaceae bacterium]|nr:hypothetical protein [Polyangiaceae bacterium]
MMTRTLLLLAALGLAAACGSGDDVGGGTSSCPSESPNACLSGSGSLLGCCPASHPVCSADGLSCLVAGSAGSAGAAGSGAGGTSSGGTSSGGTSSGGTSSGGTSSGGTSSGGTSSGGTGGAPSGGTGGGTGGSSCLDIGFEPNETEATATDLGAMTDCDSTGKTVVAKLDGATDVDFYRVVASDVAGCVVDPSFETTTQARLCAFFECPGVAVACASPATQATSPDGRKGCCIPSGGTLKATPDCSGSNDGSTVYIRMDQGPADQCTSYSVKFHY